MKYRICLLGILFVAALASCGGAPSEETVASDAPDPVSDAYRVCQAFTQTGLTTECDVKGFDSAIDVRIDMNSEEARKTCVGAVDLVIKETPSLSGRWKLRIFSPYSGEHPIATCNF